MRIVLSMLVLTSIGATSLWGQSAPMHRLKVSEVVELSIAQFNSSVDPKGRQRVTQWEGFEALFDKDAVLVNDILVLNQKDQTVEVDVNIDPLEKLTPDEIEATTLDYLQLWRHVYKQLPTFHVKVLHIDLDASNTSATCWVEKSMVDAGTLEGEVQELDALATHMNDAYPMTMKYSLVRRGENWLIAKVDWASSEEIYWHHCVKVSDGNGVESRGWNDECWRWGPTAEIKIHELGNGRFHILSLSQEVSLTYDDPSFVGQKNCAAAESQSIAHWLRRVKSEQSLEFSDMRFSPAKWRWETQLFISPDDLYNLTDGLGINTAYREQGVNVSIWKSTDREPSLNKGWRMELSGGNFASMREHEIHKFASASMDEDGDVYIRQTEYQGIVQNTSGLWGAFGLGYEYSSKSSVKPELWLGWRTIVGGGVLMPNQSVVEYAQQVSGIYDQYAGVEFTEGLYDFGFSQESSSLSTKPLPFWSFEAVGTVRLESEEKNGLALMCSGGLTTRGWVFSPQALEVDEAPDLMATSGSNVYFLPVVKLGISKLIIPNFDSTCKEAP